MNEHDLKITIEATLLAAGRSRRQPARGPGADSGRKNSSNPRSPVSRGEGRPTGDGASRAKAQVDSEFRRAGGGSAGGYGGRGDFEDGGVAEDGGMN